MIEAVTVSDLMDSPADGMRALSAGLAELAENMAMCARTLEEINRRWTWEKRARVAAGSRPLRGHHMWDRLP